MGPVDVKTHELYLWLEKQSGKKVEWNYGKYVVEKDGTTVEIYGPQSGAIVSAGLDDHIKRCLA